MPEDLFSWRELIENEMMYHNETFKDVVSCTLSEEGLDRRFDAGWGSANGEPFTLWTTNRVYFPVEYDGSERVASASRNPDGVAMLHVS